MTDKHKNIFDWNHISSDLPEDKIQELKKLFAHYHNNFWIFKQAFKHNKRMDLSYKITSTGVIVIGTIAGSITLNPIVPGSISGAGLLLGTYAETKNYNPKIELCCFACTTYAKILTDLPSCLQGIPFEEKKLLSGINLLDDNC